MHSFFSSSATFFSCYFLISFQFIFYALDGFFYLSFMHFFLISSSRWSNFFPSFKEEINNWRWNFSTCFLSFFCCCFRREQHIKWGENFVFTSTHVVFWKSEEKVFRMNDKYWLTMLEIFICWSILRNPKMWLHSVFCIFSWKFILIEAKNIVFKLLLFLSGGNLLDFFLSQCKWC